MGISIGLTVDIGAKSRKTCQEHTIVRQGVSSIVVCAASLWFPWRWSASRIRHPTSTSLHAASEPEPAT